MATMKLKNAVELTNDLDVLTADGDRQKRYEKARFLVRNKVINPDSKVSQGQTGEYGVEAVCALRLCFALYDCGFDQAAVAGFAQVFHRPETPARNPEHPEAMQRAIANVRDGAKIDLTIRIERQNEALEPKRLAAFTQDGKPLVPEIRSPIFDSISRLVGTLTVDVTALMQPVIAHFDNLASQES